MNPDLANYVKESRTHGISDEETRRALLAAGWIAADVDGALAAKAEVPALKAASSETPSTGPTDRRVPPSGKLIFIICAFVLLAGAGVTFGYMYFTKPPDPQTVLAQAWKNFYTANSWESSTTVQSRFSTGAPETPWASSSSFSFSVNNISESVNDPANYKGSVSFRGFVGVSNAPQSEYAAEATIIVPEKALYVKLNSARLGSFDLTPLTNQWIKIDLNTSSSRGFPAGYIGLPNPFFPVPISNSGGNNGLSGEQIQKIRDLATKARILKFQNALADADFEGASMYRYRLRFDQGAFIDFLKNAVAIAGATSTKTSEIDRLRDQLEKFNIAPVEVWVGKKDLLPHKLMVAVSQTATVVGDTAPSASVDIGMTAEFKNFDVTPDIKAPDGAKSPEEVMRQMLGNTVASMQQTRDSNRVSDLATLKASVSLYVADISPPDLAGCAPKTIYASAKITPPAGWKLGPNIGKTAIDGTGWLPINFNKISSGSPLGKLPVDPENDPAKGLAYVFACDPATLRFEFAAAMESSKYGKSGPSDVVSTDGGVDPKIYEVGGGASGMISMGGGSGPKVSGLESSLRLLPEGTLVPPPPGDLSEVDANITKSQVAGRDAVRIADLRQIQNALEIYFNHCGVYPGGSSATAGCAKAFTGDNFPVMEAAVIPVVPVKALPHDPTAPKQNYHYTAKIGGMQYTLSVILEDSSNPALEQMRSPQNGVICGKANSTYCVSF